MQTHFTPEALRDPGLAVAEKAIRTCVHCGFCNATCPTYTLLGDERDGPRGRIMLMKDMLERGQPPSARTVHHLDRCLTCLSCSTTCPSGVDYAHLVEHARVQIHAHYRRPWLQRVLRALLASLLPYTRRLRLARAVGRCVAPLRKLLPLRDDSAGALRALLDLAAVPARRATPSPDPGLGVRRGRVALLRGCAEPVLHAGIQASARRVLQRMGYEVVDADTGCCGALVHHLGHDAQGRAFAQHNVAVWTRLLDAGGLDAILITASGCGTQVKDYGHLLRDDPRWAAQAARVSALARDISEFIAERGLPPVATKLTSVIAYHAACSLQHGQRVRHAPQALLRAAGYTVHEPAQAHLCCGSAGVYNIVQPVLAESLRQAKQAALAATAPQAIATGNIGCLVQLSREAAVPVVHTVELLDWATGGPRPSAMG